MQGDRVTNQQKELMRGKKKKEMKKGSAAFKRKFLFAVTISIATFLLCCDYL